LVSRSGDSGSPKTNEGRESGLKPELGCKPAMYGIFMMFLSPTTNKRSLMMSLAENIDIRVTVVGILVYTRRIFRLEPRSHKREC